MYEFASIYILQYGRWTAFRQAVPLDKDSPRSHLELMLKELWLFHNFESIKDVLVTLRKYDRVEDSEWNPVKEIDWDDGSIHDMHIVSDDEYKWSESDFESFKEFKDSFLSSNIPM